MSEEAACTVGSFANTAIFSLWTAAYTAPRWKEEVTSYTKPGQSVRRTVSQTDRQTDRQRNRQTDIQTDSEPTNQHQVVLDHDTHLFFLSLPLSDPRFSSRILSFFPSLSQGAALRWPSASLSTGRWSGCTRSRSGNRSTSSAPCRRPWQRGHSRPASSSSPTLSTAASTATSASPTTTETPSGIRCVWVGARVGGNEPTIHSLTHKQLTPAIHPTNAQLRRTHAQDAKIRRFLFLHRRSGCVRAQ